MKSKLQKYYEGIRQINLNCNKLTKFKKKHNMEMRQSRYFSKNITFEDKVYLENEAEPLFIDFFSKE